MGPPIVSQLVNSALVQLVQRKMIMRRVGVSQNMLCNSGFLARNVDGNPDLHQDVSWSTNDMAFTLCKSRRQSWSRTHVHMGRQPFHLQYMLLTIMATLVPHLIYLNPCNVSQKKPRSSGIRLGEFLAGRLRQEQLIRANDMSSQE